MTAPDAWAGGWTPDFDLALDRLNLYGRVYYAVALEVMGPLARVQGWRRVRVHAPGADEWARYWSEYEVDPADFADWPLEDVGGPWPFPRRSVRASMHVVKAHEDFVVPVSDLGQGYLAGTGSSTRGAS